MAIYFVDYDALLLLPAKCGSNWLKHATSQLKLRHVLLGPMELRSHGGLSFYGKDFKTIAAFVRHPFDWHISYWNYRTNVLGQWEPDRAPVDKMCGELNFKDYIECVYKHFPNRVEEYFSRFIGEQGDRIAFVGRLENLDLDYLSLLKLIGVNVSDIDLQGIPAKNVQHNREKDDSLRHIVFENERKFYREFGYDI